VIVVSPTQSAPRISERCEIDLSPGTCAVPESGPQASEVIGIGAPWLDMKKLSGWGGFALPHT
jgi:hypothetical protein